MCPDKYSCVQGEGAGEGLRMSLLSDYRRLLLSTEVKNEELRAL